MNSSQNDHENSKPDQFIKDLESIFVFLSKDFNDLFINHKKEKGTMTKQKISHETARNVLTKLYHNTEDQPYESIAEQLSMTPDYTKLLGSVLIRNLNKLLEIEQNGTTLTKKNFPEQMRRIILHYSSMVRKPPFRHESEDIIFVGRQLLIQKLKQKISNEPCRCLILLGLSGIGKTALAEKLIHEGSEWFNDNWQDGYCFTHLDNVARKDKHFVSIAKQWLEQLGEEIIDFNENQSEEQRSLNILNQLVDYLSKNRVVVFIDALENLLTQEEKSNSWGDFQEQLWNQFFQNILFKDYFESTLIVTSQERPLIFQRAVGKVPRFIHQEVLYGLDSDEQQELFAKILGNEFNSQEKEYLQRIGGVYQGHPLLLKVTLGEIKNEEYKNNVTEYWDEVRYKIEKVEQALKEAKVTQQYEDEWELYKLTKDIRQQVYESRLKEVFERLEETRPDAFLLLYSTSVYLLPLKKATFLHHFRGKIELLEENIPSVERQEKAFDDLCDSFLLEPSLDKKKRSFVQHNLVRSISLAKRKQRQQNLNS